MLYLGGGEPLSPLGERLAPWIFVRGEPLSPLGELLAPWIFVRGEPLSPLGELLAPWIFVRLIHHMYLCPPPYILEALNLPPPQLIFLYAMLIL